MSHTIDKRFQTQCLDLLRFPLAVIILYIHIFNNASAIATDELTSGGEFLHFVDSIVKAFLSGQSVPIYFFISGYVFFWGGKLDVNIYLRKLRNRIHSLFIPYIVWNTVALLTILFFMLPWFASVNPLEQEPHFTLSSLLNTYWNSEKGVFATPELTGHIFPQNQAMWFLRDLMVLALLSPIIYFTIKHGKIYSIITFAILWLLTDYYSFHDFYFPFQGFFFFSWGSYMSINQRDLIADMGRVKVPGFMLYILLSIAHIVLQPHSPEATTIIKACNMWVGVIVAFNTAAILLNSGKCRVNRFLASSAIFIYLAQTMCAKYIFKALMILTGTDSGYIVVLITIVTLLLSLGLLLCLYHVMRRYTPSLLYIMIGRKE